MTELEKIANEVRGCPLCRLSKSRTLAVPGEGPENAEILLVGEAPGFHEDQQGRPFVGAAGQFLEKLLASINLSREDVFITNIVKCRPPGNRDPEGDEIAACRPYLERQVELIKPKIIVTLGRYSMQLAFAGASITKIHGIPKKVGDIVYFPMFHPAAALHQPKYRSFIENDMVKIPQILSDLHGVDDHPEPQEPKQLNLF